MLESLQDAVEEWGEDNVVEGFDLAHEMGVLTINMGQASHAAHFSARLVCCFVAGNHLTHLR